MISRSQNATAASTVGSGSSWTRGGVIVCHGRNSLKGVLAEPLLTFTCGSRPTQRSESICCTRRVNRWNQDSLVERADIVARGKDGDELGL